MKELKAYYRQIADCLPCSGKPKAQLMDRITATVDCYLQEHPEADFSAVQAHFGTPEQIASSFVDEMEGEDLLKALRLRKKVLRILLCCVAAVIAIWAIAVLTLWIIGLGSEFGHGVVSPPIIVE